VVVVAGDDRIICFDYDDGFFLDVKRGAIRRLGYTPITDIAEGEEGRPDEFRGANAPNRVMEIIDEGIFDLRGALGQSGPRGVYRILPALNISKGRILFQGEMVASRMWARVANSTKGDRQLLFAVITIGAEFEEIARNLSHVSSQMIYDAIGSEAVEMFTDRLQVVWEKEMGDSVLQTSYRFSPGYCDWALSGQGVIFGAVSTDKIGVRLMPSFSMIPLKSISCCAIIAREVPIKFPCLFCNKVECPYRRGG
jgi:hypothetical protein